MYMSCMYTICFTYGSEHEWFEYASLKEANRKFNALKKRVDDILRSGSTLVYR